MKSDKDLARDIAVPECFVESLRSWEHTIQRAIRSVIFDNLSLIDDLASQYTVCAASQKRSVALTFTDTTALMSEALIFSSLMASPLPDISTVPFLMDEL
jgi:hypothetical protein